MKVKKQVVISSLALVVFLLAVFFISNYFLWSNNYRYRIYSGVRIGRLDLSNKTLAEAEELIAQQTQIIERSGFSLRQGNKLENISATVTSFDSDLAYPAFTYDNTASVQAAFGPVEKHSFLNYLKNKLKLTGVESPLAVYTFDETKIRNLIQEAFKDLEIPATNAYFSLLPGGLAKANPEKLGKGLNYEQIISDIKNNLSNLKNQEITIKTETKYPEIKLIDLKDLSQAAENLIKGGDLILSYKDGLIINNNESLWHIKPEKLITWFSLKKDQNQIILTLDSEKIKQYLNLSVAPEIDREAIRPRFEIKDGKVVSWETGAKGQKLDLEANAQKITADVLSGQKNITLSVSEITDAGLSTEENFNIKEIIGTGHSNFAGSPVNRRKNIAIGAASVHGLLIKPSEEFSLVTVLGDVSKETGYFPELVIKGDKTIPEYGGGLCQIGTTIFRTALATGLPITARQNHSYRVAYYEPAGTDAAVYIPNPDVRFINDTGNYILIQSRLEKNDIYFDFWGVHDGRVATTTKPVVYNIVKPEPTKLVESDTLPLGEKKCTEKAHNGADAYFDYKVIYPEGATTTPVQERRFKSHYVPWQEVCLIGTGAASSTASSTLIIPDIKKATSTPVASSTNP